MGLDIHVMPITLALRGQFQSPLEKALGATHVRLGNQKSSASARQARDFIDRLRKLVEQHTGSAPDWVETGDPVWSEQYDHQAHRSLQKFAAHQDDPLERTRVFELDDPRDQECLVRIWRGGNTSFPHLTRFCTYYVPVGFDTPFELDERSEIGSSERLLDELDRLNLSLGLVKDWAQLAHGEYATTFEDPLYWAKFGWSVLHAAARLSVQHRLPIVFDG